MPDSLHNEKAAAAIAIDAAAEAARYALLRRIAPSMRHHLVVHLQPIGMVYEIMDRRLRADEPKLADIQDCAHKINGYAKAALASSVDVVSWLAPDPHVNTSVAAALAECLALVQTAFTFRGYALRTEAADDAAQVSRSGFRNLVTGALFFLTDDNPAPAEISIAARAEAGKVVVTLGLAPRTGEAGFGGAVNYRPITWPDVQALARADNAVLHRDGTRITISLAAG